MALDIGIRLHQGEYEHRLSFPADEHYWFLHPWLKKTYQMTSIYVDLYGDAEFHPSENMRMLEEALCEALTAAKHQPVAWPVHVGTQLRPVKKELYKQVFRDEVVQTIAVFLGVLAEAKERDATVVCLGD